MTTGYYRVNYDSTNWEKIAQYLNTEDYNKIHPGNRIQLMSTAVYLLSVKRLSPTIFFQIANYLHREVDPVVWNGALLIIENVKHSYLKSSKGAAILTVRLNTLYCLCQINVKYIHNNIQSKIRELISMITQNASYEDSAYHMFK